MVPPQAVKGAEDAGHRMSFCHGISTLPSLASPLHASTWRRVASPTLYVPRCTTIRVRQRSTVSVPHGQGYAARDCHHRGRSRVWPNARVSALCTCSGRSRKVLQAGGISKPAMPTASLSAIRGSQTGMDLPQRIIRSMTPRNSVPICSSGNLRHAWSCTFR